MKKGEINYEKIKKEFGSREEFLFMTLTHLSMSGQPCDILTYDKRYIDVKIDPNLTIPLMYGAGPKKLQEILKSIKLIGKDGEEHRVNFGEIWVINPMPQEGFTKEQLEIVDISKGDEINEFTGKSEKEMIRETYHCKDVKELDHFLRRWIAS